MSIDEQPPLAEPRRSRRFSLIWLIPIAAAISALWLGYQSLSSAGPTVEITFDTAEGLDAGHTKIRHKDVDLGTVDKITLTKDMNHVIVSAKMTSEAEPFLNTGTRFWVVKPRVTLGQVSGLTTILSGPYIEFSPGKGSDAHSFKGLSQPPVLEADAPGKYFTLTTDRLNSVAQGSPIYFHGVQVGEVLGTELEDKLQAVNIYIFVRAPHEVLVHPQTHFWNVSGFAINASAQGVRLATESLQSLLMGGIEFDTPKEATNSESSPQNAKFPLFADQSAIDEQTEGPEYEYTAIFSGSVRDLVAKAPVLLQGIPVGHVDVVHMNVHVNGIVEIPITFDIEPERLLGKDALAQLGPGRKGFDQLMGRMIARGLRARLTTSNLLTGSKMIALDFRSDATPALLDMTGTSPAFPTVSSGDVDGIMVSAQKFLNQLGSLPLAGLVDDIRRTIRVAGSTISSPEVKRSLRSLDTTLANLAETTNQAKTELTPTLRSLRNAASNAEATLSGARGQPGLGDLLQQLNDAARSLRVLADYLERHPEALIQGKTPRHD